MTLTDHNLAEIAAALTKREWKVLWRHIHGRRSAEGSAILRRIRAQLKVVARAGGKR